MTKSLSIFVAILSIMLLLRLQLFYSQKTEYKNGQNLSFEANISSEPKFFANLQTFSVALSTGETVFVKTAAYPEYNYGSRVLVVGRLEIEVLNDNQSILSLDFPQISLVQNRENYFLALINIVRQKIINVFQNTLPKDLSSLLLGIVFGIKEDFSKDFLADLRIAGVMHVIAASGMNVTMVGGFIFYFCSLFFRRQVAILISILGIIFYDFLAGFQASIIRASIMGGLAFSSQILGRQRDGIYLLFLTGFLMLFIWPQFLTDIGFQLSFASTLGILLIPNLFRKWQNALSSDFLTTFSAQVATLPILLTNFGSYSFWSIVVNALILWTVPILMILGGLAAIIALVLEPLARLLLYLCLPFLLYFVYIVSLFADFKGTINFSTFPWSLVVSYYLLLSSVIVFAFKRSHD